MLQYAFCNATLAYDTFQNRAHKIILAAASPFIKSSLMLAYLQLQKVKVKSFEFVNFGFFFTYTF